MLINPLSLTCMSDTARFVTLLISDLREKNRLHTTLLSFSRPAKACMVYTREQCFSLEEKRRKPSAHHHHLTYSCYLHCGWERHPSREGWGKRRRNHTWDLLRLTFPKSLQLTLWVPSIVVIIDDLLKAAIWGIDDFYCSTTIKNVIKSLSKPADIKLDLLIWSDCQNQHTCKSPSVNCLPKGACCACPSQLPRAKMLLRGATWWQMDVS